MSAPSQSLTRDGDVFVLHLTDGENRFNRISVDAINSVLDEVGAAEGPKALVVTGEGKFFSNGLDLEWLNTGEEDLVEFILDVTRMWARILEAPYPTVAAINGHAFAGGAMFALAFDMRVMREDRGFWCVNEVLLGMDLTPGMGALVQARLSPQVAHKALTQAHRFGGPDALAAHLVDAIAGEGEVVRAAASAARSLTGTAGEPLAVLKRRLYRPVLELLRNNP
jgi:enoyl-CoA hydratase/carnithine racemase